ncbi:hypothetical protein ACET3Z_032171 [Daucus carota]
MERRAFVPFKANTSRAVSLVSPKAQSISRTSLEPLKQQPGRKQRGSGPNIYIYAFSLPCNNLEVPK